MDGCYLAHSVDSWSSVDVSMSCIQRSNMHAEPKTYPRSDTSNQTQRITSYEIIGSRRSIASQCRGRRLRTARTRRCRDRTAQWRRTLRATGRPVLAQLPAELLTGGGPVHADVIA